MKIHVSPQVARFNAAVDRADYLLFGLWDRDPVSELVAELRRPLWGNGSAEELAAADELEAAAAALEGPDDALRLVEQLVCCQRQRAQLEYELARLKGTTLKASP